MKPSPHCFCRSVLALAIACAPLMLLAQNDESSATPPREAPETSAPQSGMNASNNKAGTLTASDSKFVREAAQGGLAEVELGKLATEKGSSDDVKKFGQRMVDDHSKANDELKQIASSKGIDVPQEISAKDKMLKAKLSKLSGPNFDVAYMESMVKDHKKDVGDFTKESTSGADPDVKEFATKTLPTLKDHLREAQGITPGNKTASRSGASE